MTSLTERNLGYGFGLLGGLLVILGAILAVALGAAALLVGHPMGAISLASEAIVLFVVGGLIGFFAYLGNHGWKERPFASGVILVVLAFIGWAFLGLGSNLLALLGGIFALLSGVLYLIEPARRAVVAAAAT